MKKDTLTIWFLCYAFLNCNGQNADVSDMKVSSFEEKQKLELPKQKLEPIVSGQNFNFRMAAKKTTPAVVHITSTYSYDAPLEFLRQLEDDFWFKFFSEGDLEKPTSHASGLIISSD